MYLTGGSQFSALFKCSALGQSIIADLWLSNNYLRWGMESILEHISFGNTAIRYVFLTENQYIDVLKYNCDRGGSKIILMTEVTFGTNVQNVQVVRRLKLEAIQSLMCNYPRKLHRLHLNPFGVWISLCLFFAVSSMGRCNAILNQGGVGMLKFSQRYFAPSFAAVIVITFGLLLRFMAR